MKSRLKNADGSHRDPDALKPSRSLSREGFSLTQNRCAECGCIDPRHFNQLPLFPPADLYHYRHCSKFDQSLYDFENPPEQW